MRQIIAGGKGFVGRAVHQLFPDAEIYDKGDEVPRKEYDFCHVCVPTPMNPDGSCNTVAVEDVISKINAELFIIRSTIPPGTTDRLNADLWEVGKGRPCVFQPEYVASSSPYPAPLADITKHPFIILGGRNEATKKVRKLYETVYPPHTTIFETDPTTAEVIKYLENSFIATKVSFCNEAFRISQCFNVDYDRVREGVFKLDPRMTEWWTYCEGKGWGGHCLPKDLAAIIFACQQKGYDPEFLKGVVAFNDKLRKGTS